jgi:alkaline phosphatase D
MPVKPVFSRPSGPAMRVNDTYDFGDLLRVHLIDGRQFRSREACYRKPDKGGGHPETAKSCPELLDPSRSMIGMDQEKWLFDGLANSKARWNVIANDVLMARLNQPAPDGEPAYWTDDWDGYPPSRKRLLDHIHDSKPGNPVVITGDIHSFWTNDLKPDFDDPKSPVVATELVGTSVSSDGPPYDMFKGFLAANPHIKFFESRKRGYVSVELTRKTMNAKYQVVSDVTDPKATLSTLAAFVVEDGQAGAKPA